MVLSRAMKKIIIILNMLLFVFSVSVSVSAEQTSATVKSNQEATVKKDNQKSSSSKTDKVNTNKTKKSSAKSDNKAYADNKTEKPRPKTVENTATDKTKKEYLFEDVFPKSSELAGGDSAWISSDIVKTSGKRYVLYEKNYTYYSTQKSMLLGMERNSTYSVSARVFSCENINIALAKYANLTAVDKTIKAKKSISPAPFGERGVMLVLPKQDREADFYLTFLFRTFVVQVYSDDGFAQIDMASDLEKGIAAYLKAGGIDFYMNKINLEVAFDNATFPDRVNFTGDNVSVVILDGSVFDADNKPVSGAKITVRETGQVAVTDEKGKYSMEISSGWGKAIYLSKMIFIPAISVSDSRFNSGVYPMKVKHALRTTFDGSVDIFLAGNRIVGKLLNKETNDVTGIAGSIQGNKLLFAAACSVANPNNRLVFKGEIAPDGTVQGDVSGCGKSGSWELDAKPLPIFKETKYLRDVGITMQNIVDSGNRIEKDFKAVKLNFSPDSILSPFYFKKGEIALKIGDVKPGVASALILCEIDSFGMEGEIFCNKRQTVARLSGLPNDGAINIDVSSYLRSPTENGYLLTLQNDNGETSDFVVDTENSVAELYYYQDDAITKQLLVVGVEVKTLAGSDLVSNAGKIKPDAEADIVLTLKISMSGRNLQSVDITGSDGNLTRRWNTNSFDIYPVIAVMQKGKAVNAEDGSIDINLGKETETFDLHIYKGTFGESGKGTFKVKCVIDGKTYESEEIKF